jgi:hypothetical protein
MHDDRVAVANVADHRTEFGSVDGPTGHPVGERAIEFETVQLPLSVFGSRLETRM